MDTALVKSTADVWEEENWCSINVAIEFNGIFDAFIMEVLLWKLQERLLCVQDKMHFGLKLRDTPPD